MPKALYLKLNVYLSLSWRRDIEENNSAKELVFHAKKIFLHESLDTKIIIGPNYIDIDEDFEPNISGHDHWTQAIPAKYEEFGTVHMLLTTKRGGLNGIARINSVCKNPNR